MSLLVYFYWGSLNLNSHVKLSCVVNFTFFPSTVPLTPFTIRFMLSYSFPSFKIYLPIGLDISAIFVLRSAIIPLRARAPKLTCLSFSVRCSKVCVADFFSVRDRNGSRNLFPDTCIFPQFFSRAKQRALLTGPTALGPRLPFCFSRMRSR